MPTVEPQKSVPPLKRLVIMVMSLNRAQETNFSFVPVLLSSTQWPVFKRFNSRQCR